MGIFQNNFALIITTPSFNTPVKVLH